MEQEKRLRAAVNVDLLLLALARQKMAPSPAEERVLVLAAPACEAEGIRRVQALRAAGIPAVLQIEEEKAAVFQDETVRREFARVERIAKGGESE